MSTQQDIYAADFENPPPMFNKENYVPWSSRLLRYAKSRPNGKLIYNSIMNGPYVRRMIPKPGDVDREVPVSLTFHEQTNDELTEKELKQIEADDQAIQTILLGLPEDIYAVVDRCETAQEIWLRVQQRMKGITNQNKNGNVIATRDEGNANGNNGNQIRCYNCRGFGHLARNYTVRLKRRGTACLQTQLLISRKEEAGIQLQAEEFDLVATVADLDEIEEVNANCIWMSNLQQASTSGTQIDKAPVYDSDRSTEIHKIVKDESLPIVNQVDARVQDFEIQLLKIAAKFVRDFKSVAKEANESIVKHKALELEIKRLLRAVVSQDIMSVVQNNSVVDTSNLKTELERTKECFENYIIKTENEYAKIWNDRFRIMKNENVELEFQVQNYEKEDAHLKIAYKNWFDYINKHKENVLNIANQTKHMPHVKKPKKVGFSERLASPKPSKPTMCLRWSPTRKMFDIKGKLIRSGDFEYLEVAFRKNTCFVRNLEGVDLLKENRTTNLYTINLPDMALVSLICLMARATSTNSWLWHRHLSHLNFDTINDLAINDLVTGLPKFKYHKEHLCPSCEQGKSKRASHPPKLVPNSKHRLHLLHMDLCVPMRIASINGKRYVLVIVDDYYHYTWVLFLRSKDEAPEEIKIFLKKITFLLQASVIISLHRRTKKIIETMNVTFDELSAMVFKQSNLKPGLQSMTSRQISSRLDLPNALSTVTAQKPTEGTLKEDACVCQPEGFIDVDHPSQVYKLMNALYGLKQAPRAWYDELSTFLLQNHFFKGTIDPTLFIRRFDDDIFVKYGMESFDLVGTLMEIKDKLDLDQNGSLVNATKYRSTIGALMYLTSSRPDIVHATCLCARYQAKPTEKHLKEMLIMRDVKTPSSVLMVEPNSQAKSWLAGPQKKKDCSTLSTTEAEYVSLSACCAQVLWMRIQLTDYGFHFNKIPIYYDLKSAIAIYYNTVQHSRTKHIAVRYHFIKEHVEKGTIKLYFAKTDYQLADLFTKALLVDQFNYLVCHLGMRSLSPQELDRLANSQ
nr:hypothetical protein [Tanacetum cinerariifolium]